MGNSSSKNAGQNFWNAARKGDREYIHQQLSQVDNIAELIEWRDSSGKTPIIAAAENGMLSCVDLLLNIGANTNAADKKGNTALHYSAANGCQDVFTYLIQAGACNAFTVNGCNQTALDFARTAYRRTPTSGILTCIQLMESKMIIYQGWLYYSADNFASTSLGMASLKGWSKRYCLVFQTHSNDILEMALFISPNGILREALPSDTIMYHVSSSATVVQSTKWFSSKQHCFRIYGYPKFVDGTSKSEVSAYEFACKTQNDLNNWMQFLTRQSIRRASQELPPTPATVQIQSPPSAPFSNQTTSQQAETPPPVPVAASSECIVCMDQARNAAAVPCGHVAACVNCLEEIKATTGTCPVCRVRITQVMRIYHT